MTYPQYIKKRLAEMQKDNDRQVQKAVRQFAQREVIHCVSSWVEASFKADIINFEDVEFGLLACDDLGYVDEAECQYCQEGEPELCDNREDREVFEWWLVDRYLFNNLQERGETVIDSDFGYIWGRATTGQAIYIDSVIIDIYKALGS
jgi:hypothetical protein